MDEDDEEEEEHRIRRREKKRSRSQREEEVLDEEDYDIIGEANPGLASNKTTSQVRLLHVTMKFRIC